MIVISCTVHYGTGTQSKLLVPFLFYLLISLSTVRYRTVVQRVPVCFDRQTKGLTDSSDFIRTYRTNVHRMMQQNKEIHKEPSATKEKMGLKAITVLRSLVSMAALSGFAMIAMGTGVIPKDELLLNCAKVFIDPLRIPASPFFLVLGSCKIFGVMKLWGFGPMPLVIARSGLMLSAFCAVVAHYVVEGSIFASLPPMVYMSLLSILLYLESTECEGVKKD